jgi:hypothetical protein
VNEKPARDEQRTAGLRDVLLPLAAVLLKSKLAAAPTASVDATPWKALKSYAGATAAGKLTRGGYGSSR